MSDPQVTVLTSKFKSLKTFPSFLPFQCDLFLPPSKPVLAPCFRLQFDLFLPSLSHATFPTHDTVDKDTVEMDMVAIDMTDMDMEVADMDN